jgi:hypothetical protein
MRADRQYYVLCQICGCITVHGKYIHCLWVMPQKFESAIDAAIMLSAEFEGRDQRQSSVCLRLTDIWRSPPRRLIC